MSKLQAAKKKAQWLAGCLEFGWNKSDLDGLSEVWDKFRDEEGNDRPRPEALIDSSLDQRAKDYMKGIDLYPYTKGEKVKQLVRAAFIAGVNSSQHGVDAVPQWYTEKEIYQWLISQSYSDQIAKELSGLLAKDLQGAFKKGWEKGRNDDRTESPYEYFPQSTPIPPGILDKLRSANPYQNNTDIFKNHANHSFTWNDCCDTLATLLSNPEITK